MYFWFESIFISLLILTDISAGYWILTWQVTVYEASQRFCSVAFCGEGSYSLPFLPLESDTSFLFRCSKFPFPFLLSQRGVVGTVCLSCIYSARASRIRVTFFSVGKILGQWLLIYNFFLLWKFLMVSYLSLTLCFLFFTCPFLCVSVRFLMTDVPVG